MGRMLQYFIGGGKGRVHLGFWLSDLISGLDVKLLTLTSIVSYVVPTEINHYLLMLSQHGAIIV